MDPTDHHPGANRAVAAIDADLQVLLAELRRVHAQESTPESGPTAGEAITLASAAMRLVETQLDAPAAELTDDEVSLAREVLREALHVLRAALAALPERHESVGNGRGRLWRRRAAHP